MARLDMETMKIVLEKNNINTNFDCIYDVGCLNGTDSILLSELFNCVSKYKNFNLYCQNI